MFANSTIYTNVSNEISKGLQFRKDELMHESLLNYNICKRGLGLRVSKRGTTAIISSLFSIMDQD